MSINYKLSSDQSFKKDSPLSMFKKMSPLVAGEEKNVIVAFLAIIINSALNLAAPLLIGIGIDTYISKEQFNGLVLFSGILLVVYLFALLANYIQVRVMGTVGQKLLYNLRNAIFLKLQELPVAFFNQNKTGDLISRINNDTDKLNQFFSQSLMQFVGNTFMIIGAGILMLVINIKLGIAALIPAILLIFVTRAVSPWIKKKNAINLNDVGGLSAEIQESINNFRVIVAFNRRDYFKSRFEEVNAKNYNSSIIAGIANNLFTPIYGIATNLGQLIILAYGVYLISTGNFTIGLLVSYISYATRFYDPLRQMANLWSSFQVALASWDRISEIMSLKSDLDILPLQKTSKDKAILEFKDVSFTYPESKNEVIKNVNIRLEQGKTYALVGPTGGGKTTTAGLMARLYDPTRGTVYLEGKDIRSYEDHIRTQKIGFILQEPILFTGTVRDNILYGNEQYKSFSDAEIEQVLADTKLNGLVRLFEKGLKTPVESGGEQLSLGQRQLIAFIRAILRKPDILILDEATANIDTVTEQLLEDILSKLPKTTTKIIIAHRLNTIENADVIFFVNGGKVTKAGSFKQAMELLIKGKRDS